MTNSPNKHAEMFLLCGNNQAAGESLVSALNFLALVAIVCFLAVGIRRMARQQPSSALGWWPERIGIWVLLVNVTFIAGAAAKLMDPFAGPHHLETKEQIMWRWSRLAELIPYTCWVPLAGFTVSMLLRILEKNKGHSQQVPDGAGQKPSP